MIGGARFAEKLLRAGVALESPILVRELRTLLRGRKFFVSHILLLVVMAGVLLIAATASAVGSGDESSRVGSLLFWSFAIGLGVVVIFLVPAFSCTALTTERESKTLELLLTTTIRPWEIVWGKLLSALVVIVLFMVSALPLVTVSFLFGGISPWDLAMLYLAVIFCTLVVSSMSLSVSSFCRESKSSVVISYVLTLVFLGVVLIGGAAVVNELSNGRGLDAFRSWFSGLPWDEKALILVVPQFLGAGVFALNFAAAANRLKPATVNRSTNVRTIWLLFMLGMVGLYMFGLWVGIDNNRLSSGDWDGVLGLTVGLAAPLLWLSSFYFASEETRLSPRLMEDVGRLRGLLVPLRAFMPGPGTGLAFSLLCAVLVLGGAGVFGAVCAAAAGDGASAAHFLTALVPVGLFLMCSAGLAALMSSFGLKHMAAGFAAFGASALLAFAPLLYLGCQQAIGGGEAHSTLWNFHYLCPVLAAISAWADPGQGRLVTFFAPDNGSLRLGIPLWQVSAIAYSLLTLGVWVLALVRIRVVRARWRAELASAQAQTQPQAGPEDATQNDFQSGVAEVAGDK